VDKKKEKKVVLKVQPVDLSLISRLITSTCIPGLE